MFRIQLLLLSCLACTPATPAEAPAAPAETPAGTPPATTAAAEPAAEPAGGEHAHGGHGHGGYHKDFSDAAGFSAHFDDPARDAWQRPAEVMDLMRIAPGSIVVDLGAGTGYFVAALSQRVGPGGKVLALDVEPKMIEFLAQRVQNEHLSNVEPRLVAPDDPELPPHGVARILIVNTWHHIDDRSAYARHLATALAPDGEIWIVDFTPESDLGPPPQHRVTAAAVVNELEAGGLRATVVEPESLPKQYLVRAVAR